MAAGQWIDRKWPRRLVLLPFGLGFLAYGVWLAAAAGGALVAGVELAGADDCARGAARAGCIVERFGRVVSGRVDYDRGPDELYVTLDFAQGGTQEVQIAYESDWRKLPAGERVRLRSLRGRPLEVISSHSQAMAARHPVYDGMNAGLEAPIFLALGLAAPFSFLALEGRGRRASRLIEWLGRRVLVPWVALLTGGLCVLGTASVLFNLRPRTMAYVGLCTALVCVALAARQRRQRSRMNP